MNFLKETAYLRRSRPKEHKDVERRLATIIAKGCRPTNVPHLEKTHNMSTIQERINQRIKLKYGAKSIYKIAMLKILPFEDDLESCNNPHFSS